MPNKLGITIGCDPEVFVTDKDTHEVISAHNLIPGTKDAPHKVSCGAIQVDGVAAEFNTDPCTSASGFQVVVATVMEELKVALDQNQIKIVAANIFPKEYFNSLPDEVKVLGCTPDYNAWTGEQTPKPEGGSTTMRTAAGHIHIGWGRNFDPMEASHFTDCCRLVKQLDYYIGMYSLMWDADGRRRSLYGKAGAFRPKPYGVEYRTPSNMWLKHPSLYRWIFTAAYEAFNSLATGSGQYLPDKFGNLAQTVIDNNDLKFIKEGRLKHEIHPHTGLTMPTWTKSVKKVKVDATI